MAAFRGVLTREELDEVVAAYLRFDAFCIDVETKGDFRGDPRRNEVFWISLSGPGRTDVIPCGHPTGKLLSPAGKERRVNPATGRLKMFPVEAKFGPPPSQLWVSEVTEALEPLLFSAARKVGHNVRFDMESLAKYYGGRIPPPPYGDTLLLARLIDENHTGNRPYALDSCVNREFGFTYEKIGKAVETHEFETALSYSYLDAKYCWLLWNRYLEQLADEKVDHIWTLLEEPILGVVMDMEMSGAPISRKRLERLGQVFEAEMGDIFFRLDKLWQDWHSELPQGSKCETCGGIVGSPFNPDADRQVAELVYDARRHRCVNFTAKTGQRQVNKDSLERYQRDRYVVDIMRWSELSKLKGSFVDGLLPKIIKGRLHGQFNQIGTTTGRFTCSEPNLQQVPVRSDDGAKVRNCFVAPKGFRLIIADFSQVELRVLAHFSRDPLLLRAYREDLDLHSITARAAYHLSEDTEVPKDKRALAKNVNFCVPTTSDALTPDGWKTHDQLQVGDLVLGYKDGELEWTPVLAVHHYEDAPLQRVRHKLLDVTATPNHRWLAYSKGRQPQFIEQDSLSREHSLVLSAMANTPNLGQVTADEAALVAWAFTDGHIERGVESGAPSQAKGTKVRFQLSIHQKKPAGVLAIEGLLTRLGVPFKHYVRSTGIQEWRVDPTFVRGLWQRAQLDEISLITFVARLGVKERKAFLEAAWQAEGWMNGPSRMLAQNNGPVQDALALAVFLSGRRPTFSSNGTYKGRENRNINFSKPFVGLQTAKFETVENGSVWCVTTALGSWVMRQGDQIMLTGNSICYGVGPQTLVTRYKVPSLTEAKHLINTFHKTYRQVRPWTKYELGKARGRFKRDPYCPPYVLTVMGRRRRLPPLVWNNDELRSRAERQAINAVIQGSAADLNKVGLIELHRGLATRHMDTKLVMSVHDEVVLVTPEDEAEEALALTKKTLESLVHPTTGKPLLRVPVEVDAKIAETWAEKG